MSEENQEYGKAQVFRPISERVAAVKAGISRLSHDKEFKVKGDVRYKYASIDAVLDAVRPLMAQQQLDAILSILAFDIETVDVTAYGKKEAKRYATMKAAMQLACPGSLDSCNPTGETREPPSTWFLEHEYNGPQTSEAMVAYIAKMFLRARFQISTGVDIEQGQESENKREAPKQEFDRFAQTQQPPNNQPPAQSESEPNQAYLEFRKRISACRTDADLTRFAAWWNEAGNTDLYNSLPDDWKEAVQAAYKERIAKVQTAAKGEEAGNE